MVCIHIMIANSDLSITVLSGASYWARFFAAYTLHIITDFHEANGIYTTHHICWI